MSTKLRNLIVGTGAMTLDAGSLFFLSYFISDIAVEYGVAVRTVSLYGFGPLLAGAIGGSIFGNIADNRGRRAGLTASLMVSGVGALIVGLGHSIFWLFFGRLLEGFTISGTWATAQSLVTETWDEKYRGRVAGIVQSGFPLSQVMIALITAAILRLGAGWRIGFIALALLLFAFALFTYFFARESPVWTEEQVNKQEKAKIRELFQPEYRRQVILASAVSLMAIMGGFSIHSWMPGYMEQLLFNPVQVANLMVITFAVATVGYISQGMIADKIGRRKTVIIYLWGAFIFAVLFGLIPFILLDAGHIFWARVTGIVLGAGMLFFTGFYTGMATIYTTLFPTRIRGTATGFCFNFGRIGNGLGPVIIAYLAVSIQLNRALIVVAPSLAVAAVLINILQYADGSNGSPGQ